MAKAKPTATRRTGTSRARQRAEARTGRSAPETASARKGRSKSGRRGLSARALAAVAAVTFGLGFGLGVALYQWLDTPEAGRPKSAAGAPAPAPEPAAPAHATAPSTREPAAREPAAPADGAAGPVAVPKPAHPPDHRGVPAWQRHAAAHDGPAAGTPRIAVVIDDLGLNRPRTRETVALPGPLTLAFMTYAPGVEPLARQARAAGHELLVHVPMQPVDQETDPGPKVLSGTLGEGELLARLTWGLARFDGFVGINNHMGSRFTTDRAGMRTVMRELKRRGLMFLDSRTIADSVAAQVADELDVPHASRDVFLDNARDVSEIRAQLAEVERVARETGSAIAIGHPHASTIRALAAWLPTLREKGLALVPVSALAKPGRGPDVAALP